MNELPGISNSPNANSFSRNSYLESHSKKIAAIIYNEWTKEKLFADCEFKDGKINENIPQEPQVTDSGLAREHLRSGYEHLWNCYQTGLKISANLCSEIKSTLGEGIS